MKTKEEVLGSILRDARGGRTQQRISQDCGIYVNKLSDYETGRVLPSLETFWRLCVGLNLDAGKVMKAVFAQRRKK